MSKRTRLTVKRASNDEKTFGDIVEMLLELHKANGLAPFNPQKAAEAIYRVLETGMCWVARLGGKNVGVIALVEHDLWYSDTNFLQDAWFWVNPEYRGKDIGVALMKAAKAEAQSRNLVLIISTANPDRRPQKTGGAVMATIAGYVPLGYMMQAG